MIDTTNRRLYSMPTQVIFGSGSLDQLPETLAGLGERPLIAIGGASMRESGVVTRISALLSNFSWTLYEGIPATPNSSAIDSLASTIRQANADVVVGVGGGSVLDTAKVASMLKDSSESVQRYLVGGAQMVEGGIPFVAIPTTAGTGSEVTPWATIWDEEIQRKQSLEHPSMFPKVALVDPDLTMTMPAALAAATGLDALAQAIEAYWSRNAQPASDAYALAAVRNVMGNLRSSCQQVDTQARYSMALGSLFAGLAFSNTKTTICHSLSYPMTARFGVIHGQAVAVTLPACLRWNANAISDKVPALLGAMNCHSVDDAAAEIESLMTHVGLATRLSDLGIRSSDLNHVITDGLSYDRAANNPRPVSYENILRLLTEIL